ncbi:MAG: beta-lactamase family protein [Burkholderiales bacterium]|nr:beta-lactamase family protein [Burkholderiales bacterium]
MISRFLFALTLWVSAVQAQPALDTSAIDAAVRQHMAQRQVPGVALGIVHHGQLVYAQGYGLANLEHQLPVTPDTVFAIASVSKPLLAIGVARLVEQGKLAWSDPISRHLPDAPASWQGITLAHLANHSSGIVRESPAFDPERRLPDIDLVRATYPVPLDFPTGTRMQYCNVCYFALAEVIARTSGQAWPDFMARELFQPAGLQDTRPTSVADLVPRRAASYEWRDGRQHNVREYVALRPSGAFLSSVRDLARFEAALAAGRLLKAETLRLLETPTRLLDGSLGKMRADSGGYGLGWELREVQGWRRVAHGGSLAGFRTQYARYPEQGWAVILLSNGSGTASAQLEQAVAQLLPRP